MVPYRQDGDRPLTIRLARTWATSTASLYLGGATFSFAFAAILAIGIVLCLDAHFVVLAFICFFGAVVAVMIGALLTFRALGHVRRWRGVSFAIELDGSVIAGETISARVQLTGRKRVPSVTMSLWRDDIRTRLVSIADLGRVDAGSETRVVELTIPRDVADDCELEVVAEDMRADPLVERFALPIRREDLGR